jgi:hypothetical protein
MNAREWSLRIAELLRRERESIVDVLLALAEFDRLVATRLVERFPEVVEPLRDGRLCMSSVVELARVMTEENRAEALPKFFDKSRQEAKQVVAEILPAQVVPARTVVTGGRVSSTVEPELIGVSTATVQARVARPVASAPRTVVEPMTSTASRMHITVSPEFIALLKKAKAGQGHVNPGATDEQVLTTALELLIEKQGKRKASVPVSVKREVRARDGGRCQWPVASGGVCGSKVRLEVDHVVPRGKGGPSTAENCRVLCRAHNLEAARLAYGDAHMDLFTRRVPTAGEPVAPYAARGPATRNLRSFPAKWGTPVDTPRPSSMLPRWLPSPRSPRRSASPGRRASACTRPSPSRASPGAWAGWSSPRGCTSSRTPG